MDDKILDIICNRLAEHFGDPNPSRACACIGIRCNNPGCASWWRFFIKNTSRETFVTMLNAYDYIINIAPNKEKYGV